MAPTLHANIALLDLEVMVPGQAGQLRITTLGSITGSWTLHGGTAATRTLEVDLDGDDLVVSWSGAEATAFIGRPWALRLDGRDRISGTVRRAKPRTDTTSVNTVTVALGDDTTVEVDLVSPSGVTAAAGAVTVPVVDGVADVAAAIAAGADSVAVWDESCTSITMPAAPTATTGAAFSLYSAVAITGDFFDAGTTVFTPGSAGLFHVFPLAVPAGMLGADPVWLWGVTTAEGEKGDPSTEPGPDGASAYQVAQANGFVGTVSEWLASLEGDPSTEPGPPGTDGKTILHGTVAPTTEGVDGDFYINTATRYLYGPKAAGAWPAGTSIVGPAGAAGASGGIAPPVPSALGLYRRIGSNMAMVRGRVYWLAVPILSADYKCTHVWIDVVTGVASCAATGAIVAAAAGRDAPGAVVASTAADAIALASSAAMTGAALSAPTTLHAGTRYFVAVLALGGSSDPTCRGIEGIVAAPALQLSPAAPVTPSTSAGTSGAFARSSQTAILDNPAHSTGYAISTSAPSVWISLEAP